MGRAEEWRGDPQVRWLLPLLRGYGYAAVRQALAVSAAVRQLLPAIVQDAREVEIWGQENRK